ncbi:MAG TPA: hypothetical protein PLE30_05545 [Candidatus Kapabacteria bacterium]|nr:hypothetical protein [Candidatus Kapabacteria bacterium]
MALFTNMNKIIYLIIILLSSYNIYAESQIKITKYPIFEKLICKNEGYAFIELENISNREVIIDSIEIIGQNYNDFISPKNYDKIISAYKKSQLKITFAPQSDGKKYAELIIYSQSNVNYDTVAIAIPLIAEKNSYNIKFEKELVDFDNVKVNDIVEKEIYVRNIGSLPIEFFKPPISKGNFEIIDINPRLLQPWSESKVDGVFRIRFKSAEEGEFIENFTFFDVCGNLYSFKVRAVVKKNIPSNIKPKLFIESYSASAGDDITITLKVINSNFLRFINSDTITCNLQVNNSVLFPTNSTPIGEIEGNIRIIPLVLDIAKDSVFNFTFKVALGNDSITKLKLSSVFANNYNEKIGTITGNFKLNNLCYANGARLINFDRIIDLKVAVQNNDIATIDYSLIESAHTQILIYDYNGNLIQTVIDKYLTKGNYNNYISLSKLSSGLYYILLRTPSYQQSFNINLIR